jgi:dUTP pyrophosphatase
VISVIPLIENEAVHFFRPLTKKPFKRFLRTRTNKQMSKTPAMQIWRTDPSAVLPSKCNASDVGFDLTIIKEHKIVREGCVIMYDTGIKLQVPSGYYVEVVPRSSLSKTGWVLANSIGIIDNTYTGNILVALARIDAYAEQIVMPFKGFQLIIREQCFPIIHDMTGEEQLIPVTVRGGGGFGSTNLI